MKIKIFIHEGYTIIEALKAVDTKERANLANLAQQFVTEKTSGLEISNIIEALTTVDAKARTDVFQALLPLLIEMMNSFSKTINVPDIQVLIKNILTLSKNERHEAHIRKQPAIAAVLRSYRKSHIPFDQNNLQSNSKYYRISKELKEISIKYNGFCDIICNLVLERDLLEESRLNIFNHITMEVIDKKHVICSHILKTISLYDKIRYYLLGKCPSNSFPCEDQSVFLKKDNNGSLTVNNDELSKSLEKITPGETLKLEVFNRNLEGHSLLVKKIDEDEFILFDPNQGEFRGLSLKDLFQIVNTPPPKGGGF